MISKNKNFFAVTYIILKLIVSENWEFFQPGPAFINFVGNIIKMTLLKVRGLGKNQIKMKRMEEMGRSSNIRSINPGQRK